MTRRDVIEEIAQVRSRRRFGHGMAELTYRLFGLEQMFREHGTNNEELVRYYPVALIACLEGYVRMAIQEIMEKGEPYLSNAEQIARDVRLDFSALRAIHGKRVSLGEIISHNVAMSKLEHVNGVLSKLLGSDLLEGLRSVSSRWEHEVKKKPALPILSKPDEAYAYVQRTFELRHTICHEFASRLELKSDEISKCFDSCVSFLRALNEYINQTLYPDAPLTQTDMNIASGKALEEAKDRLESLCKKIKEGLSPERIKEFDESQVHWEAYCAAWAHFDSEYSAGGTIRPTLYAGSARSVVEKRIEEISAFKRRDDALGNI